MKTNNNHKAEHSSLRGKMNAKTMSRRCVNK